MLPAFPNCVGLMPRGPSGSLSSLALQKGNIGPPQVGLQKTRLYLQRASRQHTINMQKHAHRCTMEYIRTHQRSFVAPVPRQICIFLCQSSQRQFCCLVKIEREKQNEEQQPWKRKEPVCVGLSQSVIKKVETHSVFLTTVSLCKSLWVSVSLCESLGRYN